MKKVALLLFAIVLFFACNNSNKEVYNAPYFKTFDTSVYFSGFYVSENYLNLVNQSKSLKLAQDSGLCIDIPQHTLKTAMMGYHFHEGVGYYIIKRGTKYQLITTPPSDSIKDLDTVYSHAINIELISQGKIKIGTEYFDRIKSANVGEELLFTGKYSSETGSAVEFTGDGKVSGLDDYKTYSARIDYYDEAMDVDQVLLGTTKQDQKEFAFKIRKDTLFIYELKCLKYDKESHICGSVGFGKLKYTLVKKG
jgi:hypothetical protein